MYMFYKLQTQHPSLTTQYTLAAISITDWERRGLLITRGLGSSLVSIKVMVHMVKNILSVDGVNLPAS